eukprot:TRINITY_DN323_c0_g1_i1.p1 TRINITY_DN323_c0_g1~~TRINITY_DN323_c0_g1_i1.p1  ORF type:complete len:139 (-),score=45.31 TRINITY_DN323_c0_g1_i1:63-479(-)
MHHGIAQRTLGRLSAHRKALLRNLTSSLVEHDRIITTLPKAKEMRRFADKIVTLAKENTLNSRRQAGAWLFKDDLVKKAFEEFPGRFANRQGGYVRVLRLGNRKGDNAPMALVEYLDRGFKAEEAEAPVIEGNGVIKS